MIINELPTADSLDVSALASIFNNTTNSYKYIFFISLLDILSRRKFDVDEPITFTELTVEMLANAWFPHTFFKLSFGTQDTITQKLDTLDITIAEPVLKFHDTDKKLLRKAIASSDLSQAIRLMEYVPFRLLSPFLGEALKDVDKGKWMVFENAMPAIANKHFKSNNPLYRFDSDVYKECRSLLINDQWAKYLLQHFSIIYGWASWNWLQYMQKRNPSTPNLASKLFMPSKRDSLSKQTAYWKHILESPRGQQLHCIYSGKLLKIDSFSLDHYLPWSFVAHDQLWNLVPTLPSINSSKSNNLPAAHYFDSFVELQHQGLIIAKDVFSTNEFMKKTEPFVADLKLNGYDLFDLAKLQEAYTQTVSPLNILALNQGFSGNWFYT